MTFAALLRLFALNIQPVLFGFAAFISKLFCSLVYMAIKNVKDKSYQSVAVRHILFLSFPNNHAANIENISFLSFPNAISYFLPLLLPAVSFLYSIFDS
jgi:hypothetical protein